MPRLARLRRTSLPIAARNATSEAAVLGNAGFSAGFGIELTTGISLKCTIVTIIQLD